MAQRRLRSVALADSQASHQRTAAAAPFAAYMAQEWPTVMRGAYQPARVASAQGRLPPPPGVAQPRTHVPFICYGQPNAVPICKDEVFRSRPYSEGQPEFRSSFFCEVPPTPGFVAMMPSSTALTVLS